ncbi:hypothetical protein EDD70_0372 [Hydrogenoanaerobacterium saccharovorans]|uniref:Uncharacterized protein n=1 Tax=Hydrogenoanaerobacterium saccharovorans TaxID=474960 RepID=A0A1H8B7Y1_9FIRM|nr:hypothetical protein [Hydrogenoanaerobacterium saccharovorans]RPF47582.1 hypothetical protein EDD70_0372 [Hydrogenoanaerobacterium saccharovorans]SEM77997.1 hypothetical protein SAMN05216180_1721 [Hydrogenoanaerobacterium saccharovorans]
MENKRSSIVKTTMNRRKRKTLGTIGIVVFAMAVIGFITVAITSINMTGRILDNTKEKQKLEHFILPVIMFDPLTFDSPQNADPLMLLQSSVWSTLLSKDRDQFVKDDYGMIILPATDVDVQAAKLFGPDVKLQHKSFGDYEISYVYDEELKAYNIPVATQMAVYTPKILKITHKGDLYTLEVGYIPPGNLWQTDAEGNTYEPEPDKIMLVELKKVKGGYNIVALKDGPDTQGVDPSQAQLVTPQVSSIDEDELASEDESAAENGEDTSSGEDIENSSSSSASSESSSK